MVCYVVVDYVVIEVGVDCCDVGGMYFVFDDLGFEFDGI